MKRDEWNKWLIAPDDEVGSWLIRLELQCKNEAELSVAMLDVVEKGLLALKDFFRPFGAHITTNGPEDINIKPEKEFTPKEFRDRIIYELEKVKKNENEIFAPRLIIITGQTYIRMYNEKGETVDKWFPEELEYIGWMYSRSPVYLHVHGGKESIGFYLTTCSDIWFKKPFIPYDIWDWDKEGYEDNDEESEKHEYDDNTLLAIINSPRLTEALKNLEKVLSAEITAEEAWDVKSIYKYGFKED